MAARPLFWLEIREPQQFGIARHIGADKGLGFVDRLRHGFKAKPAQALRGGSRVDARCSQ